MRSSVPAAAVVAVLTLGTACSGGDPSGAAPPDPSPGGASSSAAGSPGATGPADPTDGPDSTASAAPTVAPATGPQLSMPHARLRIPKGWFVGDQLVTTQKDGQDPGSTSLLSLGETPAFGSTAGPTELGRNSLKVSRRIYPMTPKQLPNAVLDGVEMYHLEGRAQPLNWQSEYGVIIDDRIIVLRFQLYARIPPAERQRIVDSVLATFEWK
ncbi:MULTISPECIES: hypothetical protein [unclassified Nocardioides]|uniref:hypothetical protein n=1 Tax=unclassified Nocardioides TaxID=2615069 RepID=UPI0000570BC0|nr:MULTISPECIES: hypothetical protein [unclassified Nocardioides]ABL80758.1 hypothetical protein Noca_1244 [Nocardioides sp. JS614]